MKTMTSNLLLPPSLLQSIHPSAPLASIVADLFHFLNDFSPLFFFFFYFTPSISLQPFTDAGPGLVAGAAHCDR